MEAWLLLAAAVLIPLLVLLRSGRSRRLPPGPPAVPLLGNLLWLRHSAADVEPLLLRLFRRYGPAVTLRIGSRLSIFVADRRLAHAALVGAGAALADRPRAAASSLLGVTDNIVTRANYGALWRLLRRNLVAETLHPSRVRLFAPARAWVRRALAETLGREAEEAQARAARPRRRRVPHDQGRQAQQQGPRRRPGEQAQVRAAGGSSRGVARQRLGACSLRRSGGCSRRAAGARGRWLHALCSQPAPGAEPLDAGRCAAQQGGDQASVRGRRTSSTGSRGARAGRGREGCRGGGRGSARGVGGGGGGSGAPRGGSRRPRSRGDPHWRRWLPAGQGGGGGRGAMEAARSSGKGRRRWLRLLLASLGGGGGRGAMGAARSSGKGGCRVAPRARRRSRGGKGRKGEEGRGRRWPEPAMAAVAAAARGRKS